jgi:hypothetical protein
MNIHEKLDEIDRTLEQHVIGGMKEINARDCGLDPRAFYRAWVDLDSEVIAIPKNQNGMARYYGGLEYVEDDAVKAYGSYVFYFSFEEDDRISDMLKMIEKATKE